MVGEILSFVNSLMLVYQAVADLAVLSEYNLPFVKIGGYFVAYKSGDVDAEVESRRRQ